MLESYASVTGSPPLASLRDLRADPFVPEGSKSSTSASFPDAVRSPSPRMRKRKRRRRRRRQSRRSLPRATPERPSPVPSPLPLAPPPSPPPSAPWTFGVLPVPFAARAAAFAEVRVRPRGGHREDDAFNSGRDVHGDVFESERSPHPSHPAPPEPELRGAQFGIASSHGGGAVLHRDAMAPDRGGEAPASSRGSATPPDLRESEEEAVPGVRRCAPPGWSKMEPLATLRAMRVDAVESIATSRVLSTVIAHSPRRMRVPARWSSAKRQHERTSRGMNRSSFAGSLLRRTSGVSASKRGSASVHVSLMTARGSVSWRARASLSRAQLGIFGGWVDERQRLQDERGEADGEVSVEGDGGCRVVGVVERLRHPLMPVMTSSQPRRSSSSSSSEEASERPPS